MSGGLEQPIRKTRLGFGGMLAVGFAAGLWTAVTPGVGPWLKSIMAGLMIVCGLALLSPFATLRPSDESQRKTRQRVSVTGGAFVVLGAAQLLPSGEARLALMGVALLLMVGPATGWPHRVFGPRS
jgi:tetrahydromethanopterin S-methyltransferase subunit C